MNEGEKEREREREKERGGECVCVRSTARAGTMVRMTVDLGMGPPGMGLLKFLRKVPHLSIPSFISKYHIERYLYILFLSVSSLHCPVL